MLSISPLSSAGDRRAFLRLPFRLYAQDPNWVPPLNRDVKAFLNTRKHPFYQDAEAIFFLARRGSRVVGRLGAIENRAHNRYHQDRSGFFGFFESEEDPAVAAALLDEAASWLKARGLTSLRGPASPSSNYPYGLLVGGDPGPPMLLMNHNPPHYAALLEAWGLKKRMDLYAFETLYDSLLRDRWERLARKVSKRCGATLRLLDRSRFEDEVRTLADIYHDAWSENWGFVPMNRDEVTHMAAEIRPILHPDFCAFVMLGGREVGVYLALPDYNVVISRLKGRLFPLGFLRLLLAKRRIPQIRMLLMGVRKKFQHLGLDALLYAHSVRAGPPNRVTRCEASWILETNKPMIHAIERGGGRLYRTYRIYEKVLAPAADETPQEPL